MVEMVCHWLLQLPMQHAIGWRLSWSLEWAAKRLHILLEGGLR